MAPSNWAYWKRSVLSALRRRPVISRCGTTSGLLFLSFDPETIPGINNHIGVASLLLNAGGNIDMQGAKAAGTVSITAGGTLTPTKGIFSGTSNGVSIAATGGALEKLFGGDVPHPGPLHIYRHLLRRYTPGYSGTAGTPAHCCSRHISRTDCGSAWYAHGLDGASRATARRGQRIGKQYPGCFHARGLSRKLIPCASPAGAVSEKSFPRRVKNLVKIEKGKGNPGVFRKA